MAQIIDLAPPPAPTNNGQPDWMRYLPSLAPPPAQPSNPIWAGLKTGGNQAIGALGSAGQAVGALTGWQGLQDYGKSVADSRALDAAKSGRSDLDQASWWDPRKIGYEIAKAVPSTAGMIGAGAAVGAAAPFVLPEAAVAGMAGLGAAVPAILGGGAKFVPRLAGAIAGGYPVMAGGNVEAWEAGHPGEPLDRGAAAGALATAVPQAAIGGLAPASFHAPVAGGLVRRLLTGGAQGAAISGPATAVQTAIQQQTMTPDMPMTERAKGIVDAAVGGSLVGGAFGGAMRAIKSKPASAVANDPNALKDVVDKALGGQDQGPDPSVAAEAMQTAVARSKPPRFDDRQMGPFALTPETELRSQIDALGAKDRTAEENTQHGLLSEELANRTKPGNKVGEGELFSPDDMGARVQAQKDFADTNPLGLHSESPLLQGVTSEPELINKANQQLNDLAESGKGKPSADLQKVAKAYELDGDPIGPKVVAQEGVVNDLWARAKAQEQRNPGMAKKLSEQAQVEQTKLERLRGIQELHTQAEDLLKSQNEPAVPAAAEEAPASAETASVPQTPEKLIDTPAAEHWDAMTRLAATDSDDAATAKSLAQTIEESTGKTQQKAIRAAKKLAADPDNAELLAAKPAEAVQAEPPPVAADQPPAEHPLIKDGSTFDSVPPAERTEPQLAVPSPADHIDDVKSAQREEAKRIASGDQDKDPFAKAAQAALDREANPKKKSDGGAVANFLNTYQDKMEKANPEGPFTKSESPVVGTANVPAEHVGFVKDLMDAHGLGGIRVMMLHPEDVAGDRGDAHALFGSYASARNAPDIIAANPDKDGHIVQFGPEGKDFAVYVKPGMSDAQTLLAYGHEVGHIVDKVQLSNAPESTRNAVNSQFIADMAAKYNLTKQDIARLKRNQATTESALGTMDPHSVTGLPEPLANLAQAKGEWFADKVAQWTMTDEKPRTAVDRFFQSLYKNWRALVSSITGDPLPTNDKVAQFLSQDRTNLTGLWQGSLDRTPQFKTSEPTAPKTPQETEQRASGAFRGADVVRDKIKAGAIDVNAAGRKLLYVADGDTIANMYSHLLPALTALRDLQQMRGTQQDVHQKPVVRVIKASQGLPDDIRAAMQRVQMAAGNRIDPFKPFEAQTAEIRNAANAADMREATIAANKDVDWLRQNGAKFDAINKLNDIFTTYKFGRLGETAAILHDVVRGLPQPLEGFRNLAEEYRLNPALHDNINLAAEHYDKGLTANVEAATKFVGRSADVAAQLDAAQKARIGDEAFKKLSSTDGDTTRSMADALESALSVVAETRTQLKQPYVHLGRDGDYFAAGNLAKGPDGFASKGAMAWLRGALDAQGMQDVALMPLSENGERIMVRVASPSQMETITKLFEEGRGLKHIEGDIARGDPADIKSYRGLLPAGMRTIVEGMKSLAAPDGVDPKLWEAAHEQHLDWMTRTLLDQHSDHALMKVNAEAQRTSGFNGQMDENLARRLVTSARTIATMATRADFSDNLQAMRDQLDQVKHGRDATGNAASPQDALRAQDAINEMLIREAGHQLHMETSSAVSALQHVTSMVYIGASPGYTVMMGSQIATLLLPVLGKSHGFLESATAIGTKAGAAIKATYGTLKDDLKFILHEDTLKAAGLSAKDARDIIMADNRGKITQSGATRAIYGGSKGDDLSGTMIRDVGSVIGRSSEMFPRILATLAAAHLYDARPDPKLTREQFIDRAIDSQLNWGPGSSSRLASPQGPFGQASPLMMAFTGFQTKMIGRLYTETHELLTNRNGNRAEAGRFLAAHLAATIVLAGTMGMPGAGALAGAADRIGEGLTGRADFDVNAMYRHWLASTFGKEVGEVIARGAPRAAGLDLSHVGEQHIIPFTDLIANKRKLEDAENDWLKGMAGSGFGLGANLLAGSRALSNGDYMEGLQKLAPGWTKGLVGAYRMTADGAYTDRNGVKLPLTVSAADILMEAMGLKPADKAEYDEKVKTMQGVMAIRQYQSQLITHHIQVGINRHDPERVQAGMQEALAFTRNNPGGRSPAADVGKDAEKTVRQGAMARGQQLPIGVRPNDPVMRRLLGY